MNRRLTREEAVKVLYIMDVNSNYSMEVLDKYLEHFTAEELEDTEFERVEFIADDIDNEYIRKTVEDAINNLSNIDKQIVDNSKGWKINRIAKVDLAILRVALAEIIYNPSIPESVSIKEAVELGKRYSNEDSFKFINGILGSVYRGM